MDIISVGGGQLSSDSLTMWHFIQFIVSSSLVKFQNVSYLEYQCVTKQQFSKHFISRFERFLSQSLFNLFKVKYGTSYIQIIKNKSYLDRTKLILDMRGVSLNNFRTKFWGQWTDKKNHAIYIQ